MSASLEALTSASTVTEFTQREKILKVTALEPTCSWCGIKGARFQIVQYRLCDKCTILAGHSLILAQQVAQILKKGGAQLYIGIERTGENSELVNVVRWSPLESLDSAAAAAESFSTFLLPQE